MDSFIPSLLSLLIFLTLTLPLPQVNPSPLPYCNTPDQPSTLKIYHIYSHCSPFKPSTPLSFEDSVLQMESKDQARLLFLSNLVAGKTVVPIASGRGIVQSPTYIVRVKIGTPAQTLMMAMDTSNDAAWVPSDGCLGCIGTTVFQSKKSRTFKNAGCGLPQCQQVPNPSCLGHTCTFNMTYGSSTIAANLTQDTLRLGTDPIPNYTFGSIQKATGSSVPPQGLLGLGRGPLSLLSQTKSLYQSTFSYCLPSFKSLNFSGSLRLGPISQPKNIKYTQLMSNAARSSLYYVNLVGIKVANKVVDIPLNALAHNPNTGAGTIIDSGTVFTRLVQPAYLAVRNEFRRRMGKAIVSSLGGFDTCYNVPVTVPSITFMFYGMNVSLTQDNFLIHSTAGSTTCLAMAAAPDNNVNSVLNVIANMQQQNHRVLFDLPNNRLGVARELCT